MDHFGLRKTFEMARLSFPKLVLVGTNKHLCSILSIGELAHGVVRWVVCESCLLNLLLNLIVAKSFYLLSLWITFLSKHENLVGQILDFGLFSLHRHVGLRNQGEMSVHEPVPLFHLSIACLFTSLLQN